MDESKLLELRKQLYKYLSDAPAEDGCTAEENEVYSDMKNLEESIGRLFESRHPGGIILPGWLKKAMRLADSNGWKTQFFAEDDFDPDTVDFEKKSPRGQILWFRVPTDQMETCTSFLNNLVNILHNYQEVEEEVNNELKEDGGQGMTAKESEWFREQIRLLTAHLLGYFARNTAFSLVDGRKEETPGFPLCLIADISPKEESVYQVIQEGDIGILHAVRQAMEREDNDIRSDDVVVAAGDNHNLVFYPTLED